jgi:predicted DNA-binding protein with PD1-like motif
MSITDNVVVESGKLARLVMARLKPNVDLTEAVEALCASHGFKNAIVRGACGSLIDANVTYASKGTPVETCIRGPGVELLNLFGEVREGKETSQVTNLHGVVADTQGRIYAGGFVRGKNLSFITVELTLQEWVPIEGGSPA